MTTTYTCYHQNIFPHQTAYRDQSLLLLMIGEKQQQPPFWTYIQVAFEFGLFCICVFLFFFFFFFFFSATRVSRDKVTVHALFTYCSRDPPPLYSEKNIKNRSHSTIHPFKNYFTTVFSVFSFQQNKLYPNGPIELIFLSFDLIDSC